MFKKKNRNQTHTSHWVTWACVQSLDDTGAEPGLVEQVPGAPPWAEMFSNSIQYSPNSHEDAVADIRILTREQNPID